MISDSKILHLPIFLITVLMLSSIGLVTTDIYLPSLPFIESSLSVTENLAKLTLPFYLVSFALSQLFYGPLSDRIGRRKAVFLGLMISLLGTVTCEFSPNIYFLFFGRFIQGLGLGAGSALARAIRRDVHSGDDLARFGSFIIIGTAILFALAPTVGGIIQQYLNWRVSFLFILFYTILNILFVLLWLPETNKELNPQATKINIVSNNYLFLIKNPVFMGYSLCSSLAFAGLTAYFIMSPFLFERVLGLTPEGYGQLGFFIATGLGLGGIFNKFAVIHLGRHRMLNIGTLVLFFSGVLMLFLKFVGLLSPWVIMMPMLFYAFGAGITFTNSFAGAFHPFPKMAGFAGGLFGCMQILGGFAISSVLAEIHQKDQLPLSIIIIVLGVIIWFFQKFAFHFSGEKK